MRLFNDVVFDEYISGTTEVFLPSRFYAELGQAEQMAIAIRVTEVPSSGVTSPTITTNWYTSNDGVNWLSGTTINGSALNIGSETLFTDNIGDSSSAWGAYMRCGIVLGSSGGTPAAHVRMTICGHAEQA